VIRGFHYRFYARKLDGDRRDLGIYVYNLNNVRVGEPIPVLDATSLEGIETNEVGDTLHEIFDPIRESGEAHAIVAYAKDRSREPGWRRLFINAFAEEVEFAASGTFRITRAVGSDGDIDLLTHPTRDLTQLDFAFLGDRHGARWRVDQDYVPLTISGS
jgi:hypothetical protein